MERAAKTLHRMSPCTPASVPAKITWFGINQIKFGCPSVFINRLALSDAGVKVIESLIMISISIRQLCMLHMQIQQVCEECEGIDEKKDTFYQ